MYTIGNNIYFNFIILFLNIKMMFFHLRIFSIHKNHFIPFWNNATSAVEAAIVAVAGAVRAA
jgi:hypothetical protein